MGDISDWVLAGYWDGEDDDPEPNHNSIQSIPSAYDKWMEMEESEIRAIVAKAQKTGYRGDPQYKQLVDSQSSWSEKQRKCLWMHFKSFIGDSILWQNPRS